MESNSTEIIISTKIIIKQYKNGMKLLSKSKSQFLLKPLFWQTYVFFFLSLIDT